MKKRSVTNRLSSSRSPARTAKTSRSSFDKESGLPVKQVAKVLGFQGQEYTAETTFADYKDFDGIKKATKIEVKRDGETFQKFEHQGVQGPGQGRARNLHRAEVMLTYRMPAVTRSRF